MVTVENSRNAIPYLQFDLVGKWEGKKFPPTPNELYVPFSTFLINALISFGYPRAVDVYTQLTSILHTISKHGTIDIRSSTSASLVQGLGLNGNNRNILSNVITYQLNFQEIKSIVREAPRTHKHLNELLFASDFDLVIDMTETEFTELSEQLGLDLRKTFQPLLFLADINQTLYKVLSGNKQTYQPTENGYRLKLLHQVNSMAGNPETRAAGIAARSVILTYESGTWSNGIRFITIDFSTLDQSDSQTFSVLPVFKIGLQAKANSDQQINNTRLAPWVNSWDQHGHAHLESLSDAPQSVKLHLKQARTKANKAERPNFYPEPHTHVDGVFPQLNFWRERMFPLGYEKQDVLLHLPDNAMNALTKPLSIPVSVTTRPPVEQFEQYLRALRKSIYFEANLKNSQAGTAHLEKGCQHSKVSPRGIAISEDTSSMMRDPTFLKPTFLTEYLSSPENQEHASNFYKEILASLIYPHTFIRNFVETRMFRFFPLLADIKDDEWAYVLEVLNRTTAEHLKTWKLRFRGQEPPGTEESLAYMEDNYNFLLYAGTHSKEYEIPEWPMGIDWRLHRTCPNSYGAFVEALSLAGVGSIKLRQLFALRNPYLIIEKLFYLGQTES